MKFTIAKKRLSQISPKFTKTAVFPSTHILHICPDGDNLHAMTTSHTSLQTGGFCQKCQTVHNLGQNSAMPFAEKLMAQLLELGRIDFLAEEENADPRLNLDYLWGPAKGQMFGVLQCRDQDGNEIILRAFSCQYNGIWQVDGWVPPILDINKYDEIVPPVEKKIKELSKIIADKNQPVDEVRKLKSERKSLSQNLMKEIHDLYHLQNFHGERLPLSEAFNLEKGIPTGTAECCAPKLLQEAAIRGLKPIALAEFYLGESNLSQTRQHRQFYLACANKCQPILGFMLCGASS